MKPEELEVAADYAEIAVSVGEKEKYLKDLNRTLEDIEILQTADIEGVKPTTHVTELRNVWREDEVKQSSQELLDDLFKLAPESEGKFYKIKKVMEG